MSLDDQAATIAFLRDPLTYGGVDDVKVIETHISMIFLAGARAFKLKRAVQLPYVDFSTVGQRVDTCRKELELNRRTAPTLYRAVRLINRGAEGKLGFDGEGVLVDAVVEMVRFDEATLFDRMAGEGLLTPALMKELARIIADFHARVSVDLRRSGSADIADVLSINERGFAATKVFAPAAVDQFNAAFRAALRRHADRLDARGRAGKVRRCHGDLHLANICLVDGRPTLFDCLEFDEAMATIDVLYDLAFLCMDLWHRGLGASANLVLNTYLDESDETDGLALMPFFMAIRASVRAHVTAKRADTAEGDNAARLRHEAQAYFDLALELLEPVPARLVAIGGFSGSGKSTLAAALAHRVGPPPGARVLGSDRLRKRLYGVAAETRLTAEAYRPEVSARVYGEIFAQSRAILRESYGVIADATFTLPESRREIEQAATEAGTSFTGLWLEAAPATLMERVDARRGDPSDATVDVVRAQLAGDAGALEWKRFSAGGSGPAIAAEAGAYIGLDPA